MNGVDGPRSLRRIACFCAVHPRFIVFITLAPCFGEDAIPARPKRDIPIWVALSVAGRPHVLGLNLSICGCAVRCTAVEGNPLHVFQLGRAHQSAMSPPPANRRRARDGTSTGGVAGLGVTPVCRAPTRASRRRAIG